MPSYTLGAGSIVELAAGVSITPVDEGFSVVLVTPARFAVVGPTPITVMGGSVFMSDGAILANQGGWTATVPVGTPGYPEGGTSTVSGSGKQVTTTSGQAMTLIVASADSVLPPPPRADEKGWFSQNWKTVAGVTGGVALIVAAIWVVQRNR